MFGRSRANPQEGGTRGGQMRPVEQGRSNERTELAASGNFQYTWEEASDFDDNPSTAHVEDVTALPMQPRHDNPPPSLDQQGYGASVRVPGSHSPSAGVFVTRQSYISNNLARYRRPARRRGIAVEPRVHISPIPEDTASTSFPYTVGGLERRIIRPLPPIPTDSQEQARESQLTEETEASYSSSHQENKRNEEEDDRDQNQSAKERSA